MKPLTPIYYNRPTSTSIKKKAKRLQRYNYDRVYVVLSRRSGMFFFIGEDANGKVVGSFNIHTVIRDIKGTRP